MGDFSVDTVFTYNGEEYRMLSDLDIAGYDVVLAVKVRDLEEGNYPVQTYVLPRHNYI